MDNWGHIAGQFPKNLREPDIKIKAFDPKSFNVAKFFRKAGWFIFGMVVVAPPLHFIFYLYWGFDGLLAKIVTFSLYILFLFWKENKAYFFGLIVGF